MGNTKHLSFGPSHKPDTEKIGGTSSHCSNVGLKFGPAKLVGSKQANNLNVVVKSIGSNENFGPSC